MDFSWTWEVTLLPSISGIQEYLKTFEMLILVNISYKYKNYKFQQIISVEGGELIATCYVKFLTILYSLQILTKGSVCHRNIGKNRQMITKGTLHF